jgi:hypothetical protein
MAIIFIRKVIFFCDIKKIFLPLSQEILKVSHNKEYSVVMKTFKAGVISRLFLIYLKTPDGIIGAYR